MNRKSWDSLVDSMFVLWFIRNVWRFRCSPGVVSVLVSLSLLTGGGASGTLGLFQVFNLRNYKKLLYWDQKIRFQVYYFSGCVSVVVDICWYTCDHVSMRFMRLQRVLVLGQLVPDIRSNIDKQPLPKCIIGIKRKIAKYQEQYCKCLRHHTLLPDKWIWSHGSLHILRRLGSATVENARDKIRMTRTLVISSLLHCSFSRLLPAAQRVGVEEAAIVRTDPVARSGPKICCQELLGESWNGMGY